MKTNKIWTVVAMVMASSAWADAPTSQIPIAKCWFEADYGKTRKECKAVASICLTQSSPIDEVPGERCEQEMAVECDGQTIFKGQWKQGYQEQPERLFVIGVENYKFWEVPRITIAPDLERKNPSVLSLEEERLEGHCELTLPNEEGAPVVFGPR